MLRGPAATLYGSNAGGVIQMFSRDGEGPPRIGAETLVGSDGLSKNHLTAEGAANGAGFVLDASRMDTDGYRDHSSFPARRPAPSATPIPRFAPADLAYRFVQGCCKSVPACCRHQGAG